MGVNVVAGEPMKIFTQCTFFKALRIKIVLHGCVFKEIVIVKLWLEEGMKEKCYLNDILFVNHDEAEALYKKTAFLGFFVQKSYFMYRVDNFK